jgi:hypothetical protein
VWLANCTLSGLHQNNHIHIHSVVQSKLGWTTATPISTNYMENKITVSQFIRNCLYCSVTKSSRFVQTHVCNSLLPSLAPSRILHAQGRLQEDIYHNSTPTETRSHTLYAHFLLSGSHILLTLIWSVTLQCHPTTHL